MLFNLVLVILFQLFHFTFQLPKSIDNLHLLVLHCPHSNVLYIMSSPCVVNTPFFCLLVDNIVDFMLFCPILHLHLVLLHFDVLFSLLPLLQIFLPILVESVLLEGFIGVFKVALILFLSSLKFQLFSFTHHLLNLPLSPVFFEL